MKRVFLLTLLSVSLFQVSQVYAEVTAREQHRSDTVSVVENKTMALTYYHKTQSFSIKYLPLNKEYVRDMRLEKKIESVKEIGLNDKLFGKGRELVVTTADGTIAFQLFIDQPFVFVKSELKNKSAADRIIEKVNPLSFFIDLGKAATQLKTLGTGGLLEPNKNPGSYVFLTTVDPVSRKGVVTAWLTNEKGSGVLFSSVEGDRVRIHPQIDYGRWVLPAGKVENMETLLIGYFDDARIGEERFADAVAVNQQIKLPARTATYCTWYAEKNGGAGSESSSIALAKFVQDSLKSYGLETIQIDDMWQSGGKYEGPRRGFDAVDIKGPYPDGMAKTAAAINHAGLRAGIWWMPFARNHQDSVYKDRQHWFAYRTDGKPYTTSWGGTSLDLTRPEALNHVLAIGKAMRAWGYKYFKMDGLWTGTVTEQMYINDGYKEDKMGNNKPLYNPLKTQIEAYRDALKSLRKEVGNEVFFSGCAVSQNMRSFGASFGLVDAMRIGPDYNHDGKGLRTGPLRASRLYFLNGRVWWNDPDPSVIRESGASTADEGVIGIGSLGRARVMPSFVAVTGQYFLSSDWLPDLPKDRLEIMKRTMASHHGIARPVDAFDVDLPTVWFASDKKIGVERNIIGLFNWEKNQKDLGATFTKIGLDPDKEYYGFDFWENKQLPLISRELKMSIPGEETKIIALRAKENHPVIVSTSQHVTQGMIDVLAEKWQKNTLTIKSKLIAGDPYELRIAGLRDGGNWQMKTVRLLSGQKDVLITISPQDDNGWLRISLRSKQDQVVDFALIFDKAT
ncbi:MAG: alpha-galactosidase [Sphingobacterium sp.]|jgi:hypothetical protein|nr:alpha-galactosidase [Sphingobacterium sp.]